MNETQINAAADLTDTQIKALRREARKAGDDLTVAICAVALVVGLDEAAEIVEDQRSALEGLGIYPEHIDADVMARAQIAKMIAANA